jgi:hypothetical protein
MRSRLAYYAASVGTLLRGPPLAAPCHCGPRACPISIALNDGVRFRVRTRLDLWLVTEPCLDDGYACVGRMPAWAFWWRTDRPQPSDVVCSHACSVARPSTKDVRGRQPSSASARRMSEM